MVSPLGPILANAFIWHYEKEWLGNCPIHFKPMIYKRYVDDIFGLFSFKEHPQLFEYYVNKQHKFTKFTSGAEHGNSFLILDMKITRHNQQFKTSAHRKPTFSGVFTHYASYLDQSYKKSLTLYYFAAFRFVLTTPYFIWKLKIYKQSLKRSVIHQKL